jgi:polysaccharide export outer membrane protein
MSGIFQWGFGFLEVFTMKAGIVVTLVVLALVAFAPGIIVAQESQDKPPQEKDASSAKSAAQDQPSNVAPSNVAPGETKPSPADAQAQAQTGQKMTPDEEAAIEPYYNNFFKSYRLGPEDVISVDVFGQPRYSKTAITVPPDGRIAYPLIPEGVLVGGKTTVQIQTEITKRLDEYIIDPKVTVSLDKAVSYKYSVIGDVTTPGIKSMPRRMTITEALAEVGGILRTGDKKKVAILRHNAGGPPALITVNVAEIYKGKSRDIELSPGDQVIVPGSRIKRVEQALQTFGPIVSFASIFASQL